MHKNDGHILNCSSTIWACPNLTSALSFRGSSTIIKYRQEVHTCRPFHAHLRARKIRLREKGERAILPRFICASRSCSETFWSSIRVCPMPTSSGNAHRGARLRRVNLVRLLVPFFQFLFFIRPPRFPYIFYVETAREVVCVSGASVN